MSLLYIYPRISHIDSSRPQDLVDFLNKTFIKNPADRWTAAQLLEHPFIQNHAPPADKPAEPEKADADAEAATKAALESAAAAAAAEEKSADDDRAAKAAAVAAAMALAAAAEAADAAAKEAEVVVVVSKADDESNDDAPTEPTSAASAPATPRTDIETKEAKEEEEEERPKLKPSGTSRPPSATLRPVVPTTTQKTTGTSATWMIVF